MYDPTCSTVGSFDIYFYATLSFPLGWPLTSVNQLLPLSIHKVLQWHQFGSSGSLYMGGYPAWLCRVLQQAASEPMGQRQHHEVNGGCKTWPPKNNKYELPLHTHADTVRVCVVFSCLSKEDVAALQHGTVFSYIGTGVMSNNEREFKGYVMSRLPPSPLLKRVTIKS